MNPDVNYLFLKTEVFSIVLLEIHPASTHFLVHFSYSIVKLHFQIPITSNILIYIQKLEMHNSFTMYKIKTHFLSYRKQILQFIKAL